MEEYDKMRVLSNAPEDLVNLATVMAAQRAMTPKAISADPYRKAAAVAGNWKISGTPTNYGLAQAILSAPNPQDIGGRTLYHPSGREMFSSLLGAGLSSYGAATALFDPLKGRLGNLAVNGRSGYNTATGKAWGPASKQLNAFQKDENFMSQFDSPEAWNTFASQYVLGPGKACKTTVKGKLPEGVSPLEVGKIDINHIPQYRDARPQLDYTINESGVPNVASYHYSYPQLKEFNPQYMTRPSTNPQVPYNYACGGHKMADGGAVFDIGSIIGETSKLATAGLGIGLDYARMNAERQSADLEAREVNALNAYARQMQANNANNAAYDVANNMFNRQALQMMAMGGDLHTHGGDYPLVGNFNVIGAGGTHEQNPFGGVPQGMAADGKPNLVEENEVVWNDYVFSNRLTIPKEVSKAYKLRDNITFAEAAKKLSKEAEERPNDPISQNGLSNTLGDLRAVQEDVKMRQEAAKIKRQINKMSPEAIMELSAAIQQAQQPQQAQMQMPQEQVQMPAELPMQYGFGGYLSTPNVYAKGGKMSREEKRADMRDKYLFNARLGQLNLDMLKAIASTYEGFDPKTHNTKDSITKFLLEQRTATGGYEDLASRIASAQQLTSTSIPEYTYTGGEYTPMDTKQWEEFLQRMNEYTVSSLPGSSSNTNATYNPDNKFEYNGRRVGKNIPVEQDVEKDPDYIAFKNDVISKVERYINGEDFDEAEQVLDYIKMLDSRINLDKGVKRLLQYNGDQQGAEPVMEDGRYKFSDSWKEDFTHRSFDKVGGIYHFYTGVPKASVDPKTGKRKYYRLNGNIVEYDESNPNPFIRVVNRTTQQGTDAEGNAVTDEIIDLADTRFEEDYKSDDKPESNPVPKSTIWRAAPGLISAWAAMNQPQRDYSTAITPRNATYEPIGDYLPYNPVDSQRYVNAENQQLANQLNAIMNASAGNRNMAMAQAALAQQQHGQNLGQILQNAEQINFDRRRAVGEFNRGTNEFNAGAFNAAELANLQNSQQLLRQAQQNAQMRYQYDRDLDTAKSANLSALADTLFGIGQENLFWNQALFNRALSYKPSGTFAFAGQSVYDNPYNSAYGYFVTPGVFPTTKAEEQKEQKALGGYLTTNKRRR